MVFDRLISFAMRDKVFGYPDSGLGEYLKKLLDTGKKYKIEANRHEGEWLMADCSYLGTCKTKILETSTDSEQILGHVNSVVVRYDKDKPGLFTPEHEPLKRISVRRKFGKIRLRVGSCPLIYTVKIDLVK